MPADCARRGVILATWNARRALDVTSQAHVARIMATAASATVAGFSRAGFLARARETCAGCVVAPDPSRKTLAGCFPTPRSRASGSAAAPVTLGVALLSAQRRSSRAVFARARRERAPDPDPDDRRLPRNGRDDEREGDDDRPHAGRDDDDVDRDEADEAFADGSTAHDFSASDDPDPDRDETDEAFADASDEWDSTCDPGQLRLNLVAAVAGSQNPRNAHVLEHLFERWRAFQLDVSTADDVTRAAELRFLAHHPAECAAAALALAVIHRAWSRTRSRVRALKAELLAEGVDLTHVDDKVETLSYLRRMRDKGTLALGLEACAARRAEAEVRFLGPNALASWREYYGERDIDLARASDMERVRRYVADLHHLEGCLLGIDLQATASEGGGFGGGGCGRP